MSTSSPVTLPRVKVYKLNPEDNQWVDSGTGHVQLDYVEKFSSIGINVVSEEDSKSVILQTKVCVDDIYQQQQDTLIVWNEPETEEDLALSFVDKKSCLELWNNLCKTQQRLKNAEKELPVASIENLEAIDKLINEISLSNRENLGISIYAEERYIDTLFDLYPTLTTPQQFEQIYSIFKGMILLNEPNLLEVLLSDDYILKLMDVLKNDPKIPNSKRVNHREFLTEVSVFKEVIPIKDEELISKIHQTFRIKYLRDSVLISVLDDTTCSTLNTMIYYNNIEILSLLQNNQQFLNDLFSALVNKENTTEQKIDFISFLQQFCELAKNLQDESRINFYKTLQKLGLFGLFEIYLSEVNRSVILPSLDLLNSTILHLPNEIREYFVSAAQTPDYPSFSAIINCMLSTEDHGVMGQIAEMIRRLIDIEAAEPNSVADNFINMFYQNFVDKLASATLPDYPITHSLFIHYNLVNQIFDIFAFCIPKHGFRIREFILHNELLEKSFRYLDTDGFLTLSVIRLFRAVLGQKNRNYERKMLQLNLFDPIMKSFINNGNRNNMINSAILELFWFIDQECYNNHKLIAHLVEKYRDDFEKITYVNAFRNLITKYDNHRDIVNSNSQDTSKKRTRDEAFSLEDESYFEHSDDDDYHAATPPTENGDGDDDDEQNIGLGLPPLSKKSEDEEESNTVVIKNKKPLQISIKSKKRANSEDNSGENNHNNNVEKFNTEKIFEEDDSDLQQKAKRQKLTDDDDDEEENHDGLHAV